jgi:hypothetical protein
MSCPGDCGRILAPANIPLARKECEVEIAAPTDGFYHAPGQW